MTVSPLSCRSQVVGMNKAAAIYVYWTARCAVKGNSTTFVEAAGGLGA